MHNILYIVNLHEGAFIVAVLQVREFDGSQNVIKQKMLQVL